LHQKRPYLDLDDAVAGLRFLLATERFDNTVYNVATFNATVNDIVDAIRNYVPDLRVELVDSPIMNQLSYEVSCERFRRLGFCFAGDLRRGVGNTIRTIRNVRADAVSDR
jgi:nucleoside-diphosphate-sugar epimerase